MARPPCAILSVKASDAMLRQHFLISASCTAMLALVSCSALQAPDPMSSGTDAMPDTDFRQAHFGGIASHEGSLEGAMSLARMTIDPSTLSASFESTAPRYAQQTDDQYELDTTIYFSPADIRITGVTGTAETIDLAYAISHPFAAPTNLAGPATASNRADLGITGRVLFLIDTPTIIGSSYFAGTDDVTVNTSLIANAAGYYKPNGLLDTTGLLANTFPYQPLVDEVLFERTVTATGQALPIASMAGNYTIPAGWKESNIAPSNAGWRGFGWLHQGQTIPGIVSLSRDAISGPVSFDVAIIAKYTDPRSGTTSAQKRANRLPIAPSSNHNLFYRANHGALDLERLTYLDEGGGFLSNTISASELRFYIVDWDAIAPETAMADLGSDISDFAVAQGASGPPSLAVCIPGVLGDATAVANIPPSALSDDDTAYGGDPGLESGIPNDPLFFRALITKGVGAGQVAGTYTGLLRAEDPEANLNRSSWYFPLNGSVIPPIPLSGTATLPEPVVYQAFEVEMAAPFPPSYLATWGGSGAETNVTSVLIEPGGGTISVGYFSGTVDFDPGAPVVNRTGGIGFNYHSFVLALDEGGAFRWVATYGAPGVATTGSQLAADSSGNLHIVGAFNATVDFDPGPGVANRTSLGSIDAFRLELAPDGSFISALTWGGPSFDFASHIAVDAADRLAIIGNFVGTVDFDPGPGVVTRTGQGSQDTFVLMLDSADAFQWVNQFGGGGMSTYCTAVAFDNVSQPVACGAFYGTSDFLPGVGTNNKTSAGGSDCWADSAGLIR